MTSTARFLAAASAAVAVSAATPAEAFRCPVLIQDAEAALNAARAIGADYKARPFMEEAVRLLNEAKGGHQEAKNAEDHNRAMAKAQTAKAAAARAGAASK